MISFEPEAIIIRWKYNQELLAGVEFNIYLENLDKETVEIFKFIPQGGPNKQELLKELPFVESATYRIGVQAQKADKISKTIYTDDFFWGYELPPPFDLQIVQ